MMTHAEMRALYADPVPPAGGDVEVQRYDMSGYGDGMVERSDGAFVHFDDHYSVVTRLQADVERLHGRVREEQTYVSELAAEHTALQSELTKARELLSTHCPNISIGVREFLSNQSAPADKG